ncbi:DUF6088 family protein [Anseongella ginsenosidimutans]|nr:DUF6088 family protein [Anseongella ginsenosidimutans]QEC51979.1 type IV toxin-antitoxin system AbiEi family antitoxin domain-containing protein [Anseongella ginsenosidimutans]
MKSVHKEIFDRVGTLKAGAIVFPTDFRGIGTEDAIKTALYRMAKEGQLERLAHGIYYLPKSHPVVGKLLPSLEEVAYAIAERERVRIRPAGAYAANKLGLSTQVPTQLVYITDGQPRQIKIGKGSIRFKPTTPKKFAMTGQISSLLIQALEEMDLEKISSEMKTRIKQLLEKETPENLLEDIKLAPAKVNDFLINIYFKPNRKNEFLSKINSL